MRILSDSHDYAAQVLPSDDLPQTGNAREHLFASPLDPAEIPEGAYTATCIVVHPNLTARIGSCSGELNAPQVGAPVAGGYTLFANLFQAYDTLSDGMKGMLDDLRTVSLYDKKKKRPGVMTPTDIDTPAEPVVHPLIRPHTS